ncbi:dTDP-4-dehydrorhamnose reductase [Niabella ginsengisoli]|uniref:dTDP-4-dehydrorhamnose reductase n=1 Tax=Niabella ginsengisoli TaxID=522298 RepID=A0ABS9SLA9_9BACT|nr:dTDP-4-dehydrorhamnose reductase [Niabella ginsengisoli]MCH5599081.1 dTDP-4-dehydrorhamnose reductase [Niabella ginsengisoli]
MSKKKILVTGANGQLGSEINELANTFSDFEFLFTDRSQLSISDENAVNDFFDKHQPDFCINCAAYTAVDKAEDPAELPLVETINADAAGFVAKACAKYHTRFIHISTDYVFDGIGTEPYKEYDKTEPVSVYGITKLKGEQNALKYTDVVIIRTAWVYSAFGKNFVKTMMRLMQDKTQINVVSDQYGTPTYAADLASAIMQIIVSENWQPGIYHYTNEGKINWHEFALAIKELIKSDCDIKAIPSIQYPTPAKRPAWSVLDKTKIKEVYNIKIPDWKESLAVCIGTMKEY